MEELVEEELYTGENGYVICNATHSVEPAPQLRWENQFSKPEKSILPIEPTEATVVANVNKSSLGDIFIGHAELNSLCRNYKERLGNRYVAFSIDFAPNKALQENSKDHDNAVIQRRYLVLVLCNVTKAQEGTYTCIAPAIPDYVKSEQIVDVAVRNPTVISGNSVRTNPGAIAGVVVAALIIVCMMVLLVLWGIRRYHLLKYEAMQMRPMTIPLAATQLTNAINHAFASFSPIGSPMYDKFEFPRENLVFLEVIGEHHVHTRINTAHCLTALLTWSDGTYRIAGNFRGCKISRNSL